MKGTVLIVNKSKEEQQLIKKVFSSFNLNLHYASHGSEALVLARRVKPTLIISQINDIGMDGITMADIIKKDKVLKETPIIFVHDELDLSLIAAAKHVNSRAFLIKPYINSSLIYAAKRALEQKEQVDTVQLGRSQSTSYMYA